MSDIQWIKPAILNQWPKSIENKGVDLNNDGIIQEEEFLQDISVDDNPIGTAEDFWVFMELHKEQICTQIDFIDSSSILSGNNPLNSYLFENQNQIDYPQIYILIKTIIDTISEIEDKTALFEMLIDTKTYQPINDLTDSDISKLLIKTVAHELNIDIYPLAHNQAITFQNENNYTKVIEIISKVLPLIESEQHHQLAHHLLYTAYYNNAIALTKNSGFETSRKLLDIALKYSEGDTQRLTIENMIGLTYRHEGISYFNQEEYKKAIELYTTALESLNKESDIDNCNKGIASAYYNIGNKLQNDGQYQDAINSYLESIKSSSDTDISDKANNMIANSYYNQAVTIYQNSPPKDTAKLIIAKGYLTKAMDFALDNTQINKINDFLEILNKMIK